MQSILVTGATGFVGGCLTRRLAGEGKRVHVLIRPTSNDWRIADYRERLTYHTVDIRDRDALVRVFRLVRPDVVYHCAVYGGYPAQTDSVRIGQVNAMGTINVLTAAVETGFGCFINTGSSGEYGPRTDLMREADPLRPTTAYGATKAAATLFAYAMAKSTDLPIVTLRLMSPYGPFEEPTRLVPAAIAKALRGEDIALSSGDESRDFFFVEDLVDLYLRVPGSRFEPGEVVNVGSGRPHTVRQVAEHILELTASASRPLWGAFDPRAYDAAHWQADVSRMAGIFGWRPETSLEQGLERTVAWVEEFVERDRQIPSAVAKLAAA